MTTHKSIPGFSIASLSTISAFAILLGGTAVSAQQTVTANQLFSVSSNCQACHNGMTEANGGDASIGVQWRASIMANASNDPYWRASVRRETIDHPLADKAIEDKCATCHMPMARYTQKTNGQSGTVFAHLPDSFGRNAQPTAPFAKDGVSCSVCHQIQTDNLGTPESFTGGFQIASTQAADAQSGRVIHGPFDIAAGVKNVMRSATGYTPQKSTHIQESELCASCHTLYTHALDKHGNEVGVLAEQVPYLEWQHSDYNEAQSCQECHMQETSGPTPIASVLGLPRDDVKKHIFMGGNAFLLSMLSKFATSLQTAATSSELLRARDTSLVQLTQNAATVSLSATPYTEEETHLTARVSISNLAGHKLPTAYPSRRVWIELKVTDQNGKTVFHSGRIQDGAIVENENDINLRKFEPHYDIITDDTQVQIYEAILGNPQNQVTTGLLEATHYIKDNRILPSGFDKDSASKDIAVNGAASTDDSFQDGEDIVTYQIGVSQPSQEYEITARLWYQSIGYRWATNLDDYDVAEPKQFIQMYRSMDLNTSATLLAETTLTISRSPLPQPDTPTDTDAE
ncbi:MAG: hypothetical protein JXX29_09820 [Deltaproteobacteria bacterium]|nr:hypothetical protein [Deltaproteobacteria bacterium]MBN2671962.1 hypothetical protein [Deltaproteobacteria bacterium]